MKYYTAEQLKRKFAQKYIKVYPLHYEVKDQDGNWVTVYLVQGTSKTIKENYNLPEESLSSY